MPLQDLTPQLRTRLNRMEKATGAFILVATFLMLFGFGFYVYKTAEDKGWFAVKAKYFTFAKTVAGLHVGDKVKIMGDDAGEITVVKPMPPDWYVPDENVYVEFVVLNEKPGYLWTEGSHVKFNDAGFLGKRELELTKGISGTGTYLNSPCVLMSLDEAKNALDLDKLNTGEEVFSGTNLVIKLNSPLKANLDKLRDLGRTNVWALQTDKPAKKLITIWNPSKRRYEPVTKETKPYFLSPDESPVLSDRLQAIVAQAQAALPGILDLTNKVGVVLNQVTTLTSNLNIVAVNARDTVTNISVITAQLRNPKGSLGEWLIPTNLNQQLLVTLDTAQGSLTRLDTNLETINLSLTSLAGITSNLNVQVQSNTNILSGISNLIVHSDEFVQGLKKFWLFRSTFAAKKKPSDTTHKVEPTIAPKYRN